MGKQKNVTLHVTEEQRKEILVRATSLGLTLKDYITKLVEEDLYDITVKGGQDNEQ